jgi:hypothetical protein
LALLAKIMIVVPEKMPRHRGDRLDSHQFADIGGKAAIKFRKASSRGTSWHPFLRKLTVINAVSDRDPPKQTSG